MEPSSSCLTVPAGVYEIGGMHFEMVTPAFAQAVADAHAAHQRVRCLCLPEGGGVPMYVARLGEGFIVKRMPETGSLHAAQCPSYEPPAEFSGLGQVLGSAIKEDPASGSTTLLLDFALSNAAGRSAGPIPGGQRDSVASDGTRLSLRGLLHYLWDEAELTRWQPGFAGKRSWATVRKLLLQAAQDKVLRGSTLQDLLYIPETFSLEHREALSARRTARWAQAAALPGKAQPLLLLIGEVKEIVPARYGFKAVIKHVPDQGFALDEGLYRRLGRRFEPELALWAASENLRMIIIATFGINSAFAPSLLELSLMPVTSHWLPVEDAFELQLIEHLAGQGRSFVKGLRYNLHRSEAVASAILTDTPESPVPLIIESAPDGEGTAGRAGLWPGPEASSSSPPWVWRARLGEMPAIPKALVHGG